MNWRPFLDASNPRSFLTKAGSAQSNTLANSSCEVESTARNNRSEAQVNKKEGLLNDDLPMRQENILLARAYYHLPLFYSDDFEWGYEAIEELDSRAKAFSAWNRPNKQNLIYYWQDGHLRCVLPWNVGEPVNAAHELMTEPNPFMLRNLKRRLN